MTEQGKKPDLLLMQLMIEHKLRVQDFIIFNETKEEAIIACCEKYRSRLASQPKKGRGSHLSLSPLATSTTFTTLTFFILRH